MKPAYISKLAFFVVVSAIGGCTGADANKAGDAIAYHKWSKLPDGSMFSSVATRGGENRTAMRCWPKENGYSCIEVGIMGTAFDAMTVAASEIDELPRIGIGFVSGNDGYSCGYVMDYREEISRDGAVLLSNAVNFQNRRWSRKFVNGFMRENQADGIPYYDCLGVLDTVKSGSLETLSTTAITYRMIQRL